MGSFTRRDEKVDTRRILSEADLGEANGTPRVRRLAELRRVIEYWPPDLRAEAASGEVPWRTLVDPTRWPDVDREEVFAFVRSYADDRGRWPLIDTLHRKFGRVSNHRLPGETEGQGVLGV